MNDFLKAATLDDFIATPLDGATAYQHKEYACGCVIFDNFPGANDPEALLEEIKESIVRATKPKTVTAEQVAEYLGVSKRRVFALADAGEIERLKHGAYDRASVEAYKLKRGDKKGGRYPSE